VSLNNYPEIEVFVMISCPMNSFLGFDDFYKLIVNPYEIELAFGNEVQ